MFWYCFQDGIKWGNKRDKQAAHLELTFHRVDGETAN